MSYFEKVKSLKNNITIKYNYLYNSIKQQTNQHNINLNNRAHEYRRECQRRPMQTKTALELTKTTLIQIATYTWINLTCPLDIKNKIQDIIKIKWIKKLVLK